MKHNQNRGRIIRCAAFTLAGLLCVVAPALAQEIARPAGKWRPRDGLYVEPGARLVERCTVRTEYFVALADKSISGNEWGCKITRLTDTAPGEIKLDMTCNDYNLAYDIKDPKGEAREFKETMLLRKIDRTSIFERKTLNGKFVGPGGPISYCPEYVQRIHKGRATARDKVEADSKVAAERSKLNPWRPPDGVYASPGTNFEDRCLKAGDATIDLAERSISSDADRCNITFIRDEPNAVRLFVICGGQQPNAQGATSTIASRRSETIILKKADDKTILMQKSAKGEFVDPGRLLAYCGPDVQKARAEQKVGK